MPPSAASSIDFSKSARFARGSWVRASCWIGATRTGPLLVLIALALGSHVGRDPASITGLRQNFVVLHDKLATQPGGNRPSSHFLVLEDTVVGLRMKIFIFDFDLLL